MLCAPPPGMPVPAVFPSLPTSLHHLPDSFLDHTSVHTTPVCHAARLNDHFYNTPVQQLNSDGEQCDIGANINATPHQHLLHHYHPLPTPFNLLGADGIHGMLCIGLGYFPQTFTNGTHADVLMYHCPKLSDTLLSPQALCTQAHTPFLGFDIICQDMDKAYVRYYSCSGPSYSDAPLTRQNNLFYFTQLSCPPRVNRLTPFLSTELWHQRLGHPGMSQLHHLQHCATGLPLGLEKHIHPLHNCKVCSNAKVRKNPMGATVSSDHLSASSRFHLDFGFMRASSDAFTQQAGATRIVESHDGYNSYLLIVDAKTRYTWIFLTASKAPPIDHVSSFLKAFGLPSGYRAVRVDQGGELWRSADFKAVVAQAGYSLEPTGADSPHQNGKAERLNGTFGAMVRSLLYSSGLPPKYWSAALVHAVHLKNRLWHSALNHTPYEAWTGTKPDLSHLRIFGSLLTSRIPGDRPAKLDKHSYDGIFLGYEGSTKNVSYIDIHSGRVKHGGHFTFDEAHFTSSKRPPGPQFLFELGLHDTPPHLLDVPTPSLLPPAPIPPLSTLALSTLPSLACIMPLPFGDFSHQVPVSSRVPSPLPQILPAAASLTAPEAMSIEFSGDPFGPSFLESISIDGIHVTAGLALRMDAIRGKLRLMACVPGTPAAQISRWRQRLQFAYLLELNGIPITTIDAFQQIIATLRSQGVTVCQIRFTFDEIRNSLSGSGLPQLYFDQLRDIRTITKSLHNTPALAHRLTRKGLQSQLDWPEWQASEFVQLDQYAQQNMFGTPCSPPPGASVFHWVWIYKVKEEDNNRKKARAVCDGSTRGGHAQINGHTYAPTPDMTELRLFFALATLENKLVYGADVSNAFAEADAPAQVYYMRVDNQFRDWWASKHHPPIPPGFVIPILKNLQGHPEAPRQWSRHIDALLREHTFVPTVHAPCIYRAHLAGEAVLFLRQVDDFAVATNNVNIYHCICDSLDSNLLVPLKRQGLLTHYNGLDIIQTRDYITLHCGTYVRKLLANHGWTDMHPTSLPMSPDNAHVRSLDTAVLPATTTEHDALESRHFRYRGAIGELIWAMITCRPELSFPVVKLSQFSINPAHVHYLAVKKVFKFLSATLDYGLTYWRTTPHSNLPFHQPPDMLTNPADRHLFHDNSDSEHFSHFALFGYVDSDWAMDIRHRRSISGIIFKLAGAAIAWKCRVQPTVSLSSTEAEFLAASDAGKMALYLRSILDELHVPQTYATLLYEDNRGALLMAHASQPTKQSRHIDIRHYALFDWVERDLIAIEDIASNLNAADIVTKQTGPILFARHVDNITGRLRPPYALLPDT